MVAYQGALGQPLVCPEDCIASLDDTMLHYYVESNFAPERLVFAGAGMQHSELVSLVEPLVSSLKPKGQPQQPTSTYRGGDFRYAFQSQRIG